MLIASNTHLLAGGAFEYEDLGPTAIKGFVEPIRVWRVKGESGLESRFEAKHAAGVSPPVGREEELDFLLRHWRQAVGAKAASILIKGEAGIGK